MSEIYAHEFVSSYHASGIFLICMQFPNQKLRNWVSRIGMNLARFQYIQTLTRVKPGVSLRTVWLMLLLYYKLMFRLR